MKIKRFFANIIVFLIAAIAVFIIGWVQFMVKPGTCGIMTSKTGGLYESPIVPGKFDWRWERLLPTNVTLNIFSTEPKEIVSSVSGELPSASSYGSLLKFVDTSATPDFTYKIELKTIFSVEPNDILELVKENKIQNQESLDAFLEQKSKLIASSLAASFLDNKKSLAGKTFLSQSEIDSYFSNKDEFNHIKIQSIELLDVHSPDLKMYSIAEDAISIWKQEIEDNLKRRAIEQASKTVENDRVMQQLEKLAGILEKYPQLNELSKTGYLTQILNELSAQGDKTNE